VAEATTRWGGATEPIIPVRKHGKVDAFWQQVCELSRVDGLVNVNLPEPEAINAATILGLACVSIQHVDLNGPGRFTCNPEAVANPTPTTPATIADPSLKLWAITASGTLTAEAHQHYVENGFPVVATKFPDQVARCQVSRTSGLDRTLEQFGLRKSARGPSEFPTIVWIAGRRQLNDCLWYWNVRALRPLGFPEIPMLFLPGDEVDHWLHFSDSIESFLSDRSDMFAPDVVFCSLGETPDRIRQIAESWGLKESDDEVRTSYSYPPPPPRTPPFTYLVDRDPIRAFIFDRSYGVTQQMLVQAFPTKTTVNFNSPVHFHKPGLAKVNLTSSEFDHLPRRQSIAELVMMPSTWNDDQLEIFTHAANQYQFELKFPSSDLVVETILNESVSSWAMSQPGRAALSILSWGNAESLLEPGFYSAILSLTTRRTKKIIEQLQESIEVSEITDLRAVASELGGRVQRLSKTVGQIDNLSSGQQTSILEKLVSLGWAERGLRVKCEKCGVTSFVPIQESSDRALCPGCRQPSAYSPSPSGVSVYYRLNSLIDLASDLGVLPHLMTNSLLLQRDPRTHLFPGVDLEFHDGSKGEADLFGIHAGSVVCGEVKSSASSFDDDEIQKCVERSKKAGADVHLMSWIGDMPIKALEKATQLAEKSGMKLLPITLEV